MRKLKPKMNDSSKITQSISKAQNSDFYSTTYLVLFHFIRHLILYHDFEVKKKLY